MPKKIKTFFHILINSFFPLEDYYKKILKTRLLFSLKYFFTLIFLFNFALWLSFIFKNLIFYNALGEFQTSLIKAFDNYPQNLIIKIRNNRLTSNFDRPYIFWLNYKNVPHPVFVIDERATKEKVYQYDSTAILINSDGVIKRTNFGLRFYPFRMKNDFIITKERVNQLKKIILRFFKLFQVLIPLLLGLLFIILFIFFSLVKIFSLAIISLLGFLVTKLFGIRTHFKKVFQISLHSVTLPLVYELSIFLWVFRKEVFFWYLLLALVFFAIAVYEVYFHPAPTVISHKTHHFHHRKHHRISK